jgi:rhomboid protease GluP
MLHTLPNQSSLPATAGPIRNIWRFFTATPVTTGLALLSILVYLAMVITGAHFANPHSHALLEWGGNYRPLTVDGQYWRLSTSIFVHGGLLHVSMNMLALFDIGHLLERQIGKLMQLVIFLLSGLVGSLCSVIWHPDTVGVGASGAIMGLAGALLVWLALPTLDQSAVIERKVQLRALLVGVSLTLGVGAFSQRIDNAAHAGGLLTGVLLGLLMYALERSQPNARRRAAGAGVLLLGGLFVVAVGMRAQSTDEYTFRQPLRSMAGIFEQYSDVNRFLRQTQGADSKPVAPQFRLRDPQQDRAYQQALGAWHTCLSLAADWQRLTLGKEQDVLARQIVNYCRLRQRQYGLLWQYEQKRLSAYAVPDPAIAQYINQANALYLEFLPALRRQLAADNAIRVLIGGIKAGKK